MVKNPPAVQETQVQALVQDDPLEKGMATLSSILAWEILWTEEPGRLQSTGSQESDTTEHLSAQMPAAIPLLPRESNGTPLQCSCLESPMDGGAW